jgi:hypothetical protein
MIQQHTTNGEVDVHMLSLARGPEKRATYYSGYIVNGFRFIIKERDDNRTTQNSGIVVKGETQHGSVPYYGQLLNIVELRYTQGNRVVLFQGEWYDVAREGIGYKIDRHGIITVNTRRKLATQEPFVLASQANQVYYIKCLKDPCWKTVVEIKPRNFFDVPEVDKDDPDDEEPFQEEGSQRISSQQYGVNDEDDQIVWNRS